MAMALENQVLAMQNINKNTRDSYNRDGYFVFKKLLDNEDITQITNSIHRLFIRQLTYLNLLSDNCVSCLDTAISTLYKEDISRYIQTISACSRLDAVQRVFYSDKVAQALQALNLTDSLIPTSPVFHIMSSSLKIPGGYYGLDAHQDWPSMQGSLDSAIFWLPLVDISKDLNPVEIVPKSHLLGVLPSEPGRNEAVVNSPLIKDDGFIPVEVNKGDLVTFSSFLVHRSSQKSNGGIRIACSLRFENLNESSFIERGFPTAYRRSVERANLGLMPSIKQIKAIYKA